ncbi:MAG: CHAD domain-containing protein [Candidatus Eremiobacteraeota bacterium]|nr:CHAD domain-containing protein [Candidatus Eremiobacteraeota bacterium]
MPKASRYPDVGPDEPLRALADAVLRSLWDAMLHAAGPVLAGDDPEAVHDTRVAIRRFRSALRAFSDCYSGSAAKRLRKRTRRLGRTLGVIRDADVHLRAVNTALDGSGPEERPGIAFVIEQIGEQRGRALAEFSAAFERFERGALAAMLDDG